MRVYGEYNSIVNNSIEDCGRGGIDIANCKGTVVVGNTIDGFGHHGISITEYLTYSNDFDDIVISGNSITGGSHTYVYSGISANASDIGGKNLIISDNIIRDADSTGSAVGGIYICTSDDSYKWNNIQVCNNVVENSGAAGIWAILTKGAIPTINPTTHEIQPAMFQP